VTLGKEIAATDLRQVLIQAPIALAIVTVVALVLGWVVAGRILRPLATITAATRRISASNLKERLSLHGPDDELKALGDTLDDLFARLEASFEAQRHFVANASHELRTPITRERTMLQVALDDPRTTETWRLGRSRRFRLARMWRTSVLAVSSVMTSLPLISALDGPRAISRSTSVSLGVSWSSTAGGGGRSRRWRAKSQISRPTSSRSHTGRAPPRREPPDPPRSRHPGGLYWRASSIRTAPNSQISTNAVDDPTDRTNRAITRISCTPCRSRSGPVSSVLPVVRCELRMSSG
jgi:HAMP domain-containing protein